MFNLLVGLLRENSLRKVGLSELLQTDRQLSTSVLLAGGCSLSDSRGGEGDWKGRMSYAKSDL